MRKDTCLNALTSLEEMSVELSTNSGWTVAGLTRGFARRAILSVHSGLNPVDSAPGSLRPSRTILMYLRRRRSYDQFQWWQIVEKETAKGGLHQRSKAETGC